MSAFTIDLTGGPPWGFSMQGGSDFNQALNISKVTTGGKAALKGIRPNLVILQVNGQDVTQLSLWLTIIQY
jgi:S1-C subfamily serine protease